MICFNQNGNGEYQRINAERGLARGFSNQSVQSLDIVETAPSSILLRQLNDAARTTLTLENAGHLSGVVGTTLFTSGLAQEICESMMPMQESVIPPAALLGGGMALMLAGALPIIRLQPDERAAFLSKSLRDAGIVFAVALNVYLLHAHHIV